MDISKLKEALEKGKGFEGVSEFNKILKKSEDIEDLDVQEKNKVYDERIERAEKSWEELTEDQIKEMKADDDLKMEKRREAEKNEMELAEITVLENENAVLEEYINNLLAEIDDKKRQLDSNVLRIDELNKIIEENK